AETVGGSERTAVFAWYNVAGTLAGGLGALAGGAPEVVARLAGVDPLAAERGGFVFYAAVAAVVALIYQRLSPSVERAVRAGQAWCRVRPLRSPSSSCAPRCRRWTCPPGRRTSCPWCPLRSAWRPRA